MTDLRTIKSVLHLDRVVFDSIEFKRLGLSSDKELALEFQSNISQRDESQIYRVTLVIKGNKPEEYRFEISVTGLFTFDSEEELDEEFKRSVVTKNAMAILMPYLRSEVSLLTAQPGMECVVLPVFNINKLFESEQNCGQ